MPVHLYGQLADMQRIREIAGDSGLQVVEDACQAHGAPRDGLRAGAAGTAAAFSFYPSKNLGAAGDAGALVTDDDALRRARPRAPAPRAEVEKYRSAFEGYTARLDTIQAIVLLHKLPHLDEWNERAPRRRALLLRCARGRRRPASSTGARGQRAGLAPLRRPDAADPEALASHLRGARDRRRAGTTRSRRISPRRSRGSGTEPGSLPVTERMAREVLSLPLFPGISEAQLAAVADAIAEYFG